MKNETTNAVRLMEQKKIPFRLHNYVGTDAVAGTAVAEVLGEDPARVFKTLVTVGKTGKYYVFMVPVQEELDLKKAAKAAGEKSIDMLPAKNLLPLTGYVHGGCSPVGMKKQFPTFIHETAVSLPTVFYSAGKIGLQAETTLAELQRMVPVVPADIVVTR